MNHAGRAGNPQRLPQKGRLLGITLDQMNHRVGRFRQRTGQDDAGKAAAAAKISPYDG